MRSHIGWGGAEGGWIQDGVPARMLGSRRGWIEGSHIDWRRELVPARTLGPEGGWIVRSHIGWGGEQNILYKGVETSPFKNIEGKPERKSPNKTISDSGAVTKFSLLPLPTLTLQA